MDNRLEANRRWFQGWPVIRRKGGFGSGHHAHAGIPGYKGGSLPGQGGVWSHHGGGFNPEDYKQSAEFAIQAAKQFEGKWDKKEVALKAKNDAAWDAYKGAREASGREEALYAFFKARNSGSEAEKKATKEKLDKIDAGLETEYQKTTETTNRLATLRVTRREEERKAMGVYVQDPASFKIDKGRLRKTDNMDKGIEEFNKLASREIGANQGESIGIERAKGRAYAKFGGKQIAISTKDNPGTVIHEMGHVLEFRSSGLQKAAQAFLGRRTAGERAKSLRAVTGAAYGSSERTKVDKFMNPYMGKQYAGGATEIVSMGVQFLWEKPAAFARQDPEYFTFIYNAMRGRF